MSLDAVNPVFDRLKTATPRERAGLAVLLAVVALFGAVKAADWAGQATVDAATAVQARADLEAMQSQLSNSVYQNQRASDAQRLWSSSLVEAEAGEAEQVLSLSVEGLAGEAGFADVTVTPSDGPPARGRVRAVDVSLQAPFEWGAFISFLSLLESSETSIAVKAIEVNDSDGMPQLDLQLGATAIQDGESR